MLTFLDLKTSGHLFGRIFELDITSHFECPRCGTSSIVPDECVPQMFLNIYPTSTGEELGRMIRLALTGADSRYHECQEVSCRQGSTCATTLTFSSSAPLVCVQTVWSFNPDRPSEVDAHWFYIPINLSGEQDQSPRYRVSGILCKIGKAIDSGHYVAIVKSSDSWWLIDDDRTSSISHPGLDAFRDGRYPVLILYAREAEVNLPDDDHAMARNCVFIRRPPLDSADLSSDDRYSTERTRSSVQSRHQVR